MEIDWHIIFVIAVVAHAIGHSLGFMHISELVKLTGMPGNESWILNGTLGLEKAITKPMGVIFLITMVGFFVAAGAFWFEVTWWKPLALSMVVLSTILFVTWFSSFPINVPIGATIGNIVVIVGLLQLT